MAIGDPVPVTGYVTQDKFLMGRSLKVIEAYLGFQECRLALGATFIALERCPSLKFELAAYSNTAQHHHTSPPGLDISKLKSLAVGRFTSFGPDRLIKVIPTIGHNPQMDEEQQYPPGYGVPQWRINKNNPIPGRIVAEPKTRTDLYKPLL